MCRELLELERLRFLGFVSTLTSTSLSEEDLLTLEEESSWESLEGDDVRSLWFALLLVFCGLGVCSVLLDFFGFSSKMISSLLAPSTLSTDLWLFFLSLEMRRSGSFSGVSPSMGGGVAEDPKKTLLMIVTVEKCDGGMI